MCPTTSQLQTNCTLRLDLMRDLVRNQTFGVASNPEGLSNATSALVSNEGRLCGHRWGSLYPIEIAHAQAIVNVLDLSRTHLSPRWCSLAELVHRRVNFGTVDIPNLGRPVSGMSPRITAAGRNHHPGRRIRNTASLRHRDDGTITP